MHERITLQRMVVIYGFVDKQWSFKVTGKVMTS